MAVHHPGAGISHHRADPLSHSWFVAMNRALGALRLAFLIGAPGEAFRGILHEITAILTESITGMVQAAAMHANHRLDGLLLSRYAGMPIRHCRLSDQITPPCFNLDAVRDKLFP
jgi:hypothetical protein